MPNSNLDLKLNFFPESASKIHLMGICGTGMAAMAGLLKASGYIVTGSDSGVYPPMSDYLAENDIEVMDGYKADNLSVNPDLVIVGNVIRRDNPEAQALARLAIPFVSFPEALSEKFLTGKRSLVVAGTHGKTTTASLLATMLAGCGLDPGFMIGGIVGAFNANFRQGDGECFVVEGDEYDTAFFDKGPKFLHYQPDIAVITSIEFDHADIYADFEAVKVSFRKLIAIMPEDGLIIACFDDPVVRKLCDDAKCRVVSYGAAPDNDWSFNEMAASSQSTTFQLLLAGKSAGRYLSKMSGQHNILNSLAVMAIFAELGVADTVVKRELANFQGVRRRQEVRGVVNGKTIIDDFAHHPTAVRETLNGLRLAYGTKRLVAIFEPRTNSSRRNIFQDAYAKVFSGADEIVIKEPEPLRDVAKEDHFSGEKLAADLTDQGKEARAFANTAQIISHLQATTRDGDILVVLSNGGFDNIHARLLTSLA